MGRVVVVGSLNVDRPWRVARHPRLGETIEGEQLAPLPGGKGLNQAVAARRMGVDVAIVGRIGDDADGRWLRAVAEGAGIATDDLEVDVDAPTGTALIVIDDAGANTVTVSPGANRRLEVGTLLVERGDVVVAQLEVPVAAIADAFGQARRVGARTVLNPSPVPGDRRLLAAADVLVVNEPEMAELTGGSVAAVAGDPVGAAQELAREGQAVVLTLGAAGVVAVAPDGVHRVEGRSVDVVDTTGAGDCFLGVLAAGLADGMLLPHALDRANRAASIAVGRLGTVPAMPTRAEVDRPEGRSRS
ncbi:MAG: ribokinase [Acidimicrobiales bacterium]|nr:ribokinase [Acidimicrobiales bacterium]